MRAESEPERMINEMRRDSGNIPQNETSRSCWTRHDGRNDVFTSTRRRRMDGQISNEGATTATELV
jgi:hypothetical protein